MADGTDHFHQGSAVEAAPLAAQAPGVDAGAKLFADATASDTRPKSMPDLPVPERLLTRFSPECPKLSQHEDGTFFNHAINFERRQKGFADANEIENALHFQSPVTGKQAGETVLSKVKSMSTDEVFAASDAFACQLSAANRPFFTFKQNWTIADEIANKLPASEAARVENVMANKMENRISGQVDGAELIKPGSGLQAGQLSEVTLTDGRRYDVYVPKDADGSGRVNLFTKGAGAGAGAGTDTDPVRQNLQEAEAANQAERYGTIAVFADQAGDDKYLGDVMTNFAGKVKSESRVTAFLADNTMTFVDVKDLIALKDK